MVLSALENTPSVSNPDQANKMRSYYRFHAAIYDLTRWAFLFGRRWLLDWLPFGRADRFTLLEIGCGTGYNLDYAAKSYPRAKLLGCDTSPDMLDQADKKLQNAPNFVDLMHLTYGNEALRTHRKADVVLFSYCLTMVNPDWQKLVLTAKKDLEAGGKIAVVDFHDSPVTFFKKWMGFNHVRMEGEILPFLKQHFKVEKYEIRRAYFGLWRYMIFLGSV